MEKSDDYIDFKAYIRYLKKVTGEPADPQALKRRILAKTAEATEMQTAYKILKGLAVAVAIVLAFALLVLLFQMFAGMFSNV